MQLGGSTANRARKPLQLGGSPRIYAGEERFGAPKKRREPRIRSSAGHFGASPSSSFTCKHGPASLISNVGHYPFFPCLADASLDCHTSSGFPSGRAAVHPAAQFLPHGSNGVIYSQRSSCGSQLRANLRGTARLAS